MESNVEMSEAGQAQTQNQVKSKSESPPITKVMPKKNSVTAHCDHFSAKQRLLKKKDGKKHQHVKS